MLNKFFVTIIYIKCSQFGIWYRLTAQGFRTILKKIMLNEFFVIFIYTYIKCCQFVIWYSLTVCGQIKWLLLG